MQTRKQNKDQQHRSQDPLLNPGQLKQIIKNLPGKLKQAHDDYSYQDTDDLESEIDEFFNYTEMTGELASYSTDFQQEFKDWQASSEQEKRSRVEYLLDQLEHISQNHRIQSGRQLLCIALAFPGLSDDTQDRIQTICINNTLLRSCDALAIVFEALKSSCASHDFVTFQEPATEEMNTLSREIDVYMSLMYLMIETMRQSGAVRDQGAFELQIVKFLFSLVSQLRDKLVKLFPVKKLIILLWKTILVKFGGFDALREAKAAARALYGLDPVNHNSVAKCTPLDVHNFRTDMSLKYPAYTPPDLPAAISSPLTVKASPELASAMGVSGVTARIDLPYQTLFPPKNANANGNTGKKQPLQQPQPFQQPASHSFILPLTKDGPIASQSTVEAGELYLKNMYLSLANYQLITERERIIRRWKFAENKDDDPFAEEKLDKSRISESMASKFDAIEQLYASIVPELRSTVVVLLKLLLSTVTSYNATLSKHQNDNRLKKLQAPLAQSVLEEVDVVRNREILSKAISGILLLLLKWTKVSHVLKFEHLSQLLVDSGCLLLILKILGLQEITQLVSSQTDVKGYSLCKSSTERSLPEEPVDADGTAPLYTNRRNMFWSINFLRILQMLTKRKVHRIMLLVQYKSSTILKRMLRVAHPTMEIYTLKILKGQVPYLGRKWRSNSMKIISAIYLNCHTSLKDDWVSKSDPDGDMEDGMFQETNLRVLIMIYNGQRYLPSMLPPQDEPSGIDVDAGGWFGAHKTESNPYDHDAHLALSVTMDDIPLDPDFMNHYEEWLEKNVYSSDAESFDDDKEASNTDMNKRDSLLVDYPGTPIPPGSPFTDQEKAIDSELLAEKIKALYREELTLEFMDKAKHTHDQQQLYNAGLSDGQNAYKDNIHDPVPTGFLDMTERLRKVEERTMSRWVDSDDYERSISLTQIGGKNRNTFEKTEIADSSIGLVN